MIEKRYQFEATVSARVRVQPDHENARLSFTVDNFDGLARWVLDFDAKAVNVYLLDELAKWMVGQSNTFRSLGTVSRMMEF